MYERILQEMALKGFKSIREVERKADVAYGTIRNIRLGHMPTSDKLFRIAGVLGVSIQYLLSGQNGSEGKELDESARMHDLITSAVEGLSPKWTNNILTYIEFLKGLDKE